MSQFSLNTGRKLNKHSRMVFFALGVVIALNFFSIFLVNNDMLYDFNTFVEAGRSLAAGENPYQYDLTGSRNLNPPISLFFFRFLANTDPLWALWSFRIVSLLLYLCILYILAKRYREYNSPIRILWALSMGAIWYTLWTGQIYAILLAITTAAWLLLKRNPWSAGVLIGILAAIKPNFIVWPILLLVSGNWRSAVTSLVSFGVLSILPVLSFGPEIYRSYLDLLLAYRATELPNNITLYGISDRIGYPVLGVALSIIVFVGLTVFVWRKRPSALETSAVALPSTLLLSPLAWIGYTIMLLPLFFSRSWSKRLTAAAILLLFPGILVFATSRMPFWIMFSASLVYPTALVLILIDVLMPLFGKNNHKSDTSEQRSMLN